MSWQYSLAQVAAYLEESSSDGERSARSKLIHTQGVFCWQDRTTAACRRFQCSMMCAHLTVGPGGEELTSSLADFPARTFRVPEPEKGSTDQRAGCGKRCSESFARYDRDSHSWKTAQCSLLGGLAGFSGSWPKSGMMLRGHVFRDSWSGHGTKGNGYLLLPTLTVCGNHNRKGASKTSGNGLATFLRERERESLPTLCARDYRTGKTMKRKPKSKKSLNEALTDGNGGPLNPSWCEWYMGFPLGWTALDVSATRNFRKWLHTHGVACPAALRAANEEGK